mgnify:CR=1 FL=1
MYKMYLLGIDKNGLHGCGMSYSMITHYKSLRKQKEIAEYFKKQNNLTSVYGIVNYTQKMCEMSGKEISEHIIKHGIKLA